MRVEARSSPSHRRKWYTGAGTLSCHACLDRQFPCSISHGWRRGCRNAVQQRQRKVRCSRL